MSLFHGSLVDCRYSLAVVEGSRINTWPFSHAPLCTPTIGGERYSVNKHWHHGMEPQAKDKRLSLSEHWSDCLYVDSRLGSIAELPEQEEKLFFFGSNHVIGDEEVRNNGRDLSESASRCIQTGVVVLGSENIMLDGNVIAAKQSNDKKSPESGRDKRVTFNPARAEPRKVDEHADSWTISAPGNVYSKPRGGKSGQTKVTKLPRASSESKLASKSALRKSASAKEGKSRTIVRCASDRFVATNVHEHLVPRKMPREDKKKRSVIIKKIAKLQKVFKKKPSLLLEESEGGDDCLLRSDESEGASTKGSDRVDSDRLLNGREASVNSNKHSPVHGQIERNRRSKASSRTAAKTKSGDSSLQRASYSSLELESAGLTGGQKTSISRLKSTSTSPAALNLLAGAEGDLSEESGTSHSPKATSTRVSFDDSQLINPSVGVAFRSPIQSSRMQNGTMGKSPTSSTFPKQGSGRKKKRSGSWYNVLSSTYRQKNEDFHKFFKDLPASERLLVDYACALVKDILVQGRLYVSQNYLCFYSTILKWQTAVTVKLVDIDQMTKEKTVKVIPNAIQVLLKDKTKLTFTTFAARDKAYVVIFRLWQNVLLDKPMSANELWSQIHRNYGDELGGCSSDDDYVKPNGEASSDYQYEFGTTKKVKKKKKSTNATQTPLDGDFEKEEAGSKSSGHSSQDGLSQLHRVTDSAEEDEDKSSGSFQSDRDELSLVDEGTQLDDEFPNLDETPVEVNRDQEEESDDEPSGYAMQDCAKVSLNRAYETSARDLYRIIFSDECSFWKDTLVNKGTTNIIFGAWQNDGTAEGQKIRELSYTLRLDNPIGPKTSFVKETQIFYPCSVEGKTYVVDCIAQNFGIPYANYFQTCMRYGIRKLTKTSCELRITSELRYRKTPWGLVKNFIEKNVASGLSDNFRKLEYQLQERIESEKSAATLEEPGKTQRPANLRRRKRRSEASETPFNRSSRLRNEREDGGGDLREPSDLNNNKDGILPSAEPTFGAAGFHRPNGFIPNHLEYERDSPKQRYFGQGGKAILVAIFFIFLVLIYSNYTLYQRLTTLEQVTAAAATADGVDPSVTAALLDRPGVPITSNPEILSTYLQAIDKRLRRLEDTVLGHAEVSNSKWEKMEKQWEGLKNMIETVVGRQTKTRG